jgi:hypothetical protein
MCFSANLSLTGRGGAGTSGIPAKVTGTGTTFVFVSSTLHGGQAIDASGNVWVNGGGDQGQLGVGDLAGRSSLTKILTDSRGLAFTNIIIVQGSYIQIGGTGAEGNYYVKQGISSDSIFYSGWRVFGMGGDGFTGSDTLMRPTLMFGLASGKRVVQMFAGVVAGYRQNDGKVFSWGANGTVSYLGRPVSGSNYATPIQITYPGADSITQVVGGAAPGILSLGKTGKLYGTSNYAGYMGNKGNPSYSSPTDLTDSVETYIFNATGSTSIMTIGATSTGFYAIANDSTLHYFGDLSMGGGGNGVASNLASPGGGSTPWFIDPSGVLLLPQTHPVQISKQHNFYGLSTGVNFAFAEYITGYDGLYSCGRNKGGVIPNGVIECPGDGGDLSSFYPDSWDVIYLIKVDPYGVSAAIPQGCAGCVSGAVTANCHACGPTSGLTCNAGGNRTINANNIVLDGTGSTSSGTIVSYVWTQISGNAATIVLPSASKATILGLTPGVHVFNLKITDNGTLTANQNVTITVNSSNTISIPTGSKIIAH